MKSIFGMQRPARREISGRRRRFAWAKRVGAILGVVAMVGSCATTAPPRLLDNACAIFDERPRWRRAVVASEAKWGAPAAIQLAIIYHESAFVHDARPPKRYWLGVIPRGRASSAYGYAQAIDGTWDWYQRDARARGANRTNFADAADFVGWYMTQSRDMLGLSMSDAYSHYLAYHEGQGGYRNGSYRQKRWLLGVAARVRSRADMYARQIRNDCPL